MAAGGSPPFHTNGAFCETNRSGPFRTEQPDSSRRVPLRGFRNNYVRSLTGKSQLFNCLAVVATGRDNNNDVVGRYWRPYGSRNGNQLKHIKAAGVRSAGPNLYRAAGKANYTDTTRAPRVSNGEIRRRQRGYWSSVVVRYGNRYRYGISCSSANQAVSHHRLDDESCHVRHCNKPAKEKSMEALLGLFLLKCAYRCAVGPGR